MNEQIQTVLGDIIPSGRPGVALLSVFLVIACVLLHYEVLRQISKTLSRLVRLHRLRVLVLIIGLLVTHVVEIWIYSAAYWLVDRQDAFGHLAFSGSDAAVGWIDHLYFSFITYTTVGYGDIVPVGPIRFIAATEALNGWLLLGWSASFTFLEMQRFWRDSEK